MDSDNIVCPVCTLYLRPGITLKSHLSSHPKQKVIEALVRLSNPEQPPKEQSQLETKNVGVGASTSNGQSWNQTPGPPANLGPVPGNHSFIYQQFMSTSSPQPNVLNVNPLTQQYVTIPTVFSPQMMCPPYVYQQQQVIMSSGPNIPPLMPRPLPIEMPPTNSSIVTISDVHEEMVQQTADEAQKDEVDETNNKKSIQNEESCEDGSIIRKSDVDDLSQDDFQVKDDDNIEEAEDNEMDPNSDNQAATEQEDCYGSPRSHAGSDWSVRVRTDLSKACQTLVNTSNFSPPATPQGDVDCMETLYVQNDDESHQQEFYYAVNSESIPEDNSSVQQAETVFAPTTSVIASAEQINFVDVEEMQIMLSNDFISGQLISQVENFDTQTERAGVLMTIGAVDGNNEFPEDRVEESASRESAIANIRADERMPARGELSGQESNGGASDIAWTQVQYTEGASQMSGTYDLIAREHWDVSDASDGENSRNNQINARFSPQLVDIPTVVSYTDPPLNFKCGTCDEAFKCLQDRQQHVKERHQNAEQGLNIVGSNIGRKKTKKIVVKPKKEEIEIVENNFDNVFTNKLKTEASVEGEAVQCTTGSGNNQPTIEVQEEKRNALKMDLKLICSICEAVLPSRKALQLHKLNIHNVSTDIRHKCATCGEAFPNEYKYTEHLRVHPLECRLCGKFFYRRQNIQLHMKRHLGIRPYKCDICEKSFLTKQKRDEHKNVHTGDAPIKCSLCDETFRRHSNLVQHRNIHHFNIKKKVKDFICVCGEIFHSKKKLAWHKEIHEAKPKSCAHCSEKFIHMASLTRHMRRAHNDRFVPKEERSAENVECPICKGVYLRSSLEVHIRNHSGQRPFTCLICNKDFTTKWNLKLHKWTHASRTSKPYRCDQCKGAFIRETDYVAHMNSHKSVRPYTCNYCGAQFIRKYNCQRHVKEHEKGKSFSCQICGKSFHRSYYLKDHMRVHSGLRPFACHICGKTSTTKSNHNKHVRIHHAREPVSTEN